MNCVLREKTEGAYTGYCSKLSTQLARIKGVTSITCVDNSCDKFLTHFFEACYNIDVVCRNVKKVSIDGQYLVTRSLSFPSMKEPFSPFSLHSFPYLPSTTQCQDEFWHKHERFRRQMTGL